MYTPSAPWTVGQTVTDAAGNQWIASGPRSIKRAPVNITSPEDCCHYNLQSQEVVVGGLPADPVFSPPGKSDGDTLEVCYPNGIAAFTCANGVWAMDYFKSVQPQLFGCPVDGDPPEALEEGAQLFSPTNLGTSAAYARANDGDCDANEGLPIGKADDGTLRQQPPLKCARQNAARGQFTVAGPALTPLAADGDVILWSEMCVNVENDSCHLIVARAIFRSNFTMFHAAGQQNYWTLTADGSQTFTGGGAGNWTGITIRRQTTCASSDCVIRESVPVNEVGVYTLPPGATARICQTVSALFTDYEEDNTNLLQVGASAIAVTGFSCQGGRVPSSAEAPVVEV